MGWSGLGLPDLRELCEAFGLPADGKKADLVRRIEARLPEELAIARSKRPAEDEAAPSVEQEEARQLAEVLAAVEGTIAAARAEVEKATKSAKAVKERQVARQNKLFSGKRPAGQWIKGKVKEFQETCAKVDGQP